MALMHKVLVSQSYTYICIKRILSTSNCIYSLCLEQSDLVSCTHSTIVFVGFFCKSGCQYKSTSQSHVHIPTAEVGSMDWCLLLLSVPCQQPCCRWQEADAQPVHV